MKTIVHPASERGHANHGWLNARHSFSFASYHDPSKMHFGLLRVLNDDIVAPGTGFGMHPHDNMEIVTIPLRGTLEHRDSMGNIGVIRPNEIQAMSAGSGLMHSEYNHSRTEDINLLQIWVFPKLRNIPPRYDQKVFDAASKKDRFKTIVAPEKNDEVMWINQDSWFSLGHFDSGASTSYSTRLKGNGAYVFVIEGEIEINGNTLGKRDAMGIWDTEQFDIIVKKEAEILVIEVPMQ